METTLQEVITQESAEDLQVAEYIEYAAKNPSSVQVLLKSNYTQSLLLRDRVVAACRRWLQPEAWKCDATSVRLVFPLQEPSCIICTDEAETRGFTPDRIVDLRG